MKRLRLLGHPLHPVTVHLPIGLLLTTTAFDVIAAVTELAAWSDRAIVILICGLITAALTVATGFIDFLAVSKRPAVERTAKLHLTFATAALSVYGLSLWLRHSSASGAAVLLTSAVGAGLLLTAGWLGGQLVYHHGEGVQRGGSADGPEERR